MTNFQFHSQRPDVQDHEEDAPACKSRREFLLTSGFAATVVVVGSIPGMGWAGAKSQYALKAAYPRQKIGAMSVLKKGKPVEFAYPYPNVVNYLIKLGAPAGGGVGPEKDIVAFNTVCTHMGGPLQGSYKEAHQVMGPCPLHLTTFDLTRHGMVVSGHATESLPQIVLETEGDHIYAVGVLGLLYGYGSNLSGRRYA